MKHIHISELRAAAPTLRCGEQISLSGKVYTARDAAHKRFFEALASGKELPFDIKDSVIYYCGPTPAPSGLPIGSAGPTTSKRMDPYAPTLYDMGMLATIGKGERSEAVRDAIKRNGALYLCALGGAGALAAKSITSLKIIALEELGCESVKEIELNKFPVFVACDTLGNSIYDK